MLCELRYAFVLWFCNEIGGERKASSGYVRDEDSWSREGDMEKTHDECQPTTRKAGSALVLVSLVIQFDKARCEGAHPTCHEVS
jgi:hypothetical protein